MVNLTPLGTRLIEAEKAARQELIRGCTSDLARLERLMAGPLERAKAALHEELLSIGDLEPTLRANLQRENAEKIALECAWDVFANANVRFRARFGLYASAVAEAEQEFINAARAAIGDFEMHVHGQRRISVPHLRGEDERYVVPDCEISWNALGEWIGELSGRLRDSLVQEVERTLDVVTERGSTSVIRTRITLRYACSGKKLML